MQESDAVTILKLTFWALTGIGSICFGVMCVVSYFRPPLLEGEIRTMLENHIKTLEDPYTSFNRKMVDAVSLKTTTYINNIIKAQMESEVKKGNAQNHLPDLLGNERNAVSFSNKGSGDFQIDQGIKSFFPNPKSRTSLVTLCLTKSLNLSKTEKMGLISKLIEKAPKYDDSLKKEISGKILITNEMIPAKTILISQNTWGNTDQWLLSNMPAESRPAMDLLPKAVLSTVEPLNLTIDRLVVIINHEFRFKDTEFKEWGRFKSVVFVLLEGPIPDYFEWGHINKLKESRKALPDYETKVRIFKRQMDKGMDLEEMADLASIVDDLIKY